MQFLHSGFLWGLLALAIPIIIHLFSFRRFKTVYFSNVAFLKEIREETAAKSNLKHWLILASRLFALLFLVLAFAQPFIPKENTNQSYGTKNVSIFIDNSFSAAAQQNGVSLLDKEKQTALEIIQNYAPTDKFQILTHDFSGKHQRLVSKDEFKQLVDEIEITPASQPLSAIANRQKDALFLENNPTKVAYILSDFQEKMGTLSPDTAIKYNLVPFAAAEQSNVYIDSCWFYEPVQLKGQNNKLFIRIKNDGENALENARLELKLNGQVKAITNFDCKEKSELIDTISFVIDKTGWNDLQLSIEDYPITFDDIYFMSFNVLDKINVLSINDGNSSFYFDALFKNLKEVNYTTTSFSTINYSQIKQNNFVIVNNLSTISSGLQSELIEFLKNGGSLLVIPAENADLNNFNSFLAALQMDKLQPLQKQEVAADYLNTQSKIFRDIFEKTPKNISLPIAKRYFPIQTMRGAEILMRLKNGNPLVAQYNFDKSAVYLITSSIASQGSDLQSNALFAPMLYKMAIENIQASTIAHTLGSKEPIVIRLSNTNTATDKVLKMSNGKMEFIPEQQKIGDKLFLYIKNQLKTAGIYQLNGEIKTENQPLIAINNNRAESVMRFFDATELSSKYTQANVKIYDNKNDNVSAVIKENDQGTNLWKWCIVAVLLFLLAEILLVRYGNRIFSK